MNCFGIVKFDTPLFGPFVKSIEITIEVLREAERRALDMSGNGMSAV